MGLFASLYLMVFTNQNIYRISVASFTQKWAERKLSLKDWAEVANSSIACVFIYHLNDMFCPALSYPALRRIMIDQARRTHLFSYGRICFNDRLAAPFVWWLKQSVSFHTQTGARVCDAYRDFWMVSVWPPFLRLCFHSLSL